jgi:type III restriction enzyme
MASSPNEPQNELPIQPVERPILCSPYDEPTQHWVYDTSTGAARKEAGRRPASYWFKTEKTGTAQGSLFAEEQRDDLPLVNILREDLARWRASGYRGATKVTRDLLNHWRGSERKRRLFFCQIEAVETLIYLAEIRLPGRTSRLQFKPRLSDDDLRSLLAGERPSEAFNLPITADFWPTLIDQNGGANPLRRVAAKVATGAGKTVVMSMLIAWSFCNRAMSPSSREFPDVALVCAPNLTVKERLQVLRPEHPQNYYAEFDIVPVVHRSLLGRGRVIIENWHRFAEESPHKVGDRSFAVVNKGRETPELFARRILNEDTSRLPILVLNDEGHHCWRPAAVDDASSDVSEEELREATIWSDGLDRLNAAGGTQAGIALVVDLSATPFYIAGSGHPEGRPFPWIVSDFGLVDAIESGITKIPRLPVSDTTGRPDPRYFRLWESIKADLQPTDLLPGRSRKPKPEAVWREAQAALVQIMGQWKERFDYIQAASIGQDKTPPCLILVCDNTDIAQLFYEKISGEREQETVTELEAEAILGEDEDEGEQEVEQPRKGRNKRQTVFGRGAVFPEYFSNTAERRYTIRIDSDLLSKAEAGKLDSSKSKREAAERLRRIVATVGKKGEPGEHVRCVVSVSMLTEGWDANNVTNILGLRAFGSQLLCEQVVGRGLRRMDYDPDPATGLLNEEYADVYGIPFSVIPFRGRPTKKTEPDDRPKNHVFAVPERAHMEMRFPVVEGYAFALKRGLIRCDLDNVERLIIEPSKEPTGTFVRPQVGHSLGGVSSIQSPFGFDEQDRAAYYRSVHIQTLMFEAAKRVVDDLTDTAAGRGSDTKRRVFALQSRHALFPQVFRAVERFVETKIDWNGAPQAELGLEKYMLRLVERLRDAIEPDTDGGESPLLPLLNRYTPVGSTSGVDFKTPRPVVSTGTSHINQVVADTGSWEQIATFRLEEAVKSGFVEFYARNEGMGFIIPYEFLGADHSYEPDFLVRLTSTTSQPLTLLLEIKGHEDDQVKAKHSGARRWVSAVNNWGQLGQWCFHVCRNPQLLGKEIEYLVGQRKSAA